MNLYTTSDPNNAAFLSMENLFSPEPIDLSNGAPSSPVTTDSLSSTELHGVGASRSHNPHVVDLTESSDCEEASPNIDLIGLNIELPPQKDFPVRITRRRNIRPAHYILPRLHDIRLRSLSEFSFPRNEPPDAHSSCSVRPSVTDVQLSIPVPYSRHIPTSSMPLSSLPRNNSISRTNRTVSTRNDNADDSISILYENIQPVPELSIVNEITRDNVDSMINEYNLARQPLRIGETGSQANFSRNFRGDATHVVPVVMGANDKDVILENLRINIKESNRNDKKTSPVKENTPKIECGICFDGSVEISASNRTLMSTVCGHVFCNSCIKTSIKTTPYCPKCRKKLTMKQVHPLYF